MPLPRYAPSGRVVDVGGELFGALDFTFLQGTFLQGEVSLPRRGRKPEGLEQAPQRLRMAEWLLVRARGTDKAGTPETKSRGFLLYTLPRLDSNQ